VDTLFVVVNVAVLPAWLLMILLPHWPVTRAVLRSPWVLVPLPALYAVLVVLCLGDLAELGPTPGLAAVSGVFARPNVFVLAWVHFLAFDLFVGRWCYLDSRERGVSAWLMAPVLLITFMMGPLGLLAYLGVRAVAGTNKPVPG
jgi:hypothetical protein